MASSKDRHPDLDPRKKAPKRHFGNLMMPRIAHPPGSIPLEYQTQSDVRSRRMAMLLITIAGGLVLCGFLVLALREKQKVHEGHPPTCVSKPNVAKPHATPEQDSTRPR